MALNPDGTKTCGRCHTSKPVSEFYRYKRTSGDGFTHRCIVCAKESAVAWQKANPTKKAASDKKRRIKNAGRAAVDIEFREKRAEAVRRWTKAHPEYIRQHQKAYKERDPERRRQQTQCHNNNRRAIRLGRISQFTWQDWKATLAAFHNSCAFCGVTGALLDIEHVVAVNQGGHNVRENIVPACRPCNAQKSQRTLEEFCKLRGLDALTIRHKVQAAIGLTGTALSDNLDWVI